jgi:hypothetical protein
MTTWIWEVGELGSVTRRADREALKQFITRRQVSERLPYGRLPVEKPAVASFIGTVNNEGGGFLTDPTGNRRFAVCTLTNIDWRYTKLDVNKIWAQAYALYVVGEPWEMTTAEQQRRDEINEIYRTEEPLADLMFQKFDLDPARASQVGWQMTTADILISLGFFADDRSLAMRLANILKQAGLEKTTPLRIDGTDKKARFWRGLRRMGEVSGRVRTF